MKKAYIYYGESFEEKKLDAETKSSLLSCHGFVYDSSKIMGIISEHKTFVNDDSICVVVTSPLNIVSSDIDFLYENGFDVEFCYVKPPSDSFTFHTDNY